MLTNRQSRERVFLLLIGLALFLADRTIHAEPTSNVIRRVDYVASDVVFEAYDHTAMLGRLVLPGTNRPRAVVIYVQTAEGATIDMRRPLGQGKTFNYHDLYREKLTAMSVGYFSYEGRGIRMGENPPRYEKIDWAVYNTSTLENKVRDVWSAIEAVRQQDGLRDTPILLMGASEGTLLAVEAAARKPGAVAGLVLYGVMASNLKDTFKYIMSDGDFLRYQKVDENRDGAITQAEWEKIVKGQDFSKADLDKDGTFTVTDIRMASKKYLDAIAADDFEVLQAWAKSAAGLSVPEGWFKDHFVHADIWTFLPRLNIPIGCFHGEADNMAPVSAVRALEAKAKKARLNKVEFHYFDGLDHSLNIGHYFVSGTLPKGHQAIFEFINRIVPRHAEH